MFSFGDDITLYSHFKNGRDGKWVRTQIKGVSWYGGSKATVGDSGLISADRYTVRVRTWSLGGHVPPDIWNALPAPPDGAWTVQNGDVVVKGLVDDEVASGITEITRKYADCFTVTGVYDNRRELLQHLRIEGS